MIRGLAHHIWLLITIRHPMTGLPTRSIGLMISVFALSAIASVLRFENPMAFIVHMALLFLVTSMSSVQTASAYALLSLGIDLIAIPVESAVQQRSMTFFSVWEAIGAAYIVWRHVR